MHDSGGMDGTILARIGTELGIGFCLHELHKGLLGPFIADLPGSSPGPREVEAFKKYASKAPRSKIDEVAVLVSHVLYQEYSDILPWYSFPFFCKESNFRDQNS